MLVLIFLYSTLNWIQILWRNQLFSYPHTLNSAWGETGRMGRATLLAYTKAYRSWILIRPLSPLQTMRVKNGAILLGGHDDTAALPMRARWDYILLPRLPSNSLGRPLFRPAQEWALWISNHFTGFQMKNFMVALMTFRLTLTGSFLHIARWQRLWFLVVFLNSCG